MNNKTTKKKEKTTKQNNKKNTKNTANKKPKNKTNEITKTIFNMTTKKVDVAAVVCQTRTERWTKDVNIVETELDVSDIKTRRLTKV